MVESNDSERATATQNCGEVELPPRFSSGSADAGHGEAERGADAYSAYRRRRHFASLDGVRCVSILAVLWHHSPTIDFTPLTRGFLGVDLFFVLSGFLITTLLLRERDATGTISLRAFYMRRVLRIFPLYYAVLFGQALVLALLKPGSEMAKGFFDVLPWYVTYTANWGPKENLFAHAWSLAVEEQFYLVWPPLLALLGMRAATWLLVAFLALNQALDFGAFGPESIHLARKLASFSAVGLGVLLARLLHSPPSFARIAAWTGNHHFVWLPIAALAGLVWIPGDIGGWPRLCIHLTMAALVAAVVVPERHALMGLFRHRLVRHIGMISYGMYLLHQLCYIPVARVVGREPGWKTPVFFALGTVATVVVATFSYRTFESYFLRLKTRFERKR
ncbi:MAG: acyltransferase [Planctomycetota bacterium]